MKNKKGMELALNFIVIIIITIVVFGYGLYFATTFFDSSSKLKDKTLDEIHNQMEGLLCSDNEPVCIGVSRQTVKRGEYKVFSLQIANRVQNDATFSFTVTSTKKVSDYTPATSSGVNSDELNFLYNTNSFTLSPNEVIQFPIGIEALVDSDVKTTYIINVEVLKDGNAYPPQNPVQKMYLKVE